MPSSWFDPKQKSWIIYFNPLQRTKGERARRVRLQGDHWTEAAADAMAAECERYCRLLETSRLADDVRHALKIKAITPDQAEALLAGGPVPAAAPVQKVTIEQAALDHPATKRQPLADRWEYLRYLQEFQTFAGVTLLGDLRLDHVQRYIEHMRAKPLRFATRKHRLMYIRRAAAMGAAKHGLPDPLGRMVLDRNEDETLADAWTLDELAVAIHRLTAAKRLRPLAAIALGGVMGLRPSECMRCVCSDPGEGAADGLAIAIPTAAMPARRPAKNRTSRRLLPMPGWAGQVIHAVRGGRPPTEALLMTASMRGSRPFTEQTYAHWLGPILAEATGRALPAKSLRHSFLSWTTRAGVHPQHADAFAGHSCFLLNEVSRRHYWSGWLLEQLRPTATLIDQALTEALARNQQRALEGWDPDRLAIGRYTRARPLEPST